MRTIHTLEYICQDVLPGGDQLLPIPLCVPGPQAHLQRIVVQAPVGHSTLIHCGPWSLQNTLLTQYQWTSGLPLLKSSTATLRRLQNRTTASSHVAFQKWATTLGTGLPDNIWDDTWLSYRSAKENTFLWQLAYRAIATQSWRHPNCSQADPRTHCNRCTLAVKEDILHCVWQCPESSICWCWCETVLARAAATNIHRIQLRPAHVVVAEWLPDEWNVPAKLWQILRAAMFLSVEG